MSWRHPAWDVLGLEPTEEIRAIRRAYAVKLKAIDVEKDPKAFIELREAFETAQRIAPWVNQQDDDEEADEDADFDDFDGDDPVASEEPGFDYGALMASSHPGVAEAERVESAEAARRAIAAFLYPGGAARTDAPTEAEANWLIDRFEIATRDLADCSPEKHAEYSRWWSELLAAGWPASRPLLPLAARAFEWGARGIPADASPSLAFLIERLAGDPDEAPVAVARPSIAVERPAVIEPPASADAPAPPAPRSPWAPITPEDADAHARALSALLFNHGGERGRWATSEEDAEMLSHWKGMIADPRMEQLTFFADAERWFSDMLARTIPFSDVLVMPATQYFGWMRSDGTIVQTHSIATITDRYRLLEFMHRCQDPANEHYAAWQELVTPAEEHSRRGKVSTSKVHRLIHRVRETYPDLEGCFDPFRVALWKPPSPSPRGFDSQSIPVRPATEASDWIKRIGVPGGILILILVLRIFSGAIGDSDSARQPTILAPIPTWNSQKLDRMDPDIQNFLRTVADGTLEWPEVQRRNPGLAQLLKSNWDIYKTEGKARSEFEKAMHGLMLERVAAGTTEAPYLTIHNLRQLSMRHAMRLRDISPELCDDFFTGKKLPPSAWSEAERDAERKVFSRILLETDVDADEVKDNATFRVSGQVMEKVRKRAGMPRDRLDQALTGKGTPADRCNARIALTGVALELPPDEAIKLLRSM